MPKLDKYDENGYRKSINGEIRGHIEGSSPS